MQSGRALWSTVAAAGFQLAADHLAVDDLTVSRRRLDVALSRDPARRMELLEDLRRLCADTAHPSALRRLVAPIVRSDVAASAGVSVAHVALASASDTSLLRVLLQTEAVQGDVIDIVLESVAQCDCAGDAGMPGDERDALRAGRGAVTASLDANPARMLLFQLRWLEWLVDPQRLTSKLREVLSVVELGLRREIIAVLPEIVVDAQHADLVELLESLATSDPQLVVPTLEALSQLQLSAQLQAVAVRMALDALQSTPLASLPVIVRFLFQAADESNAAEIVKGLRDGLAPDQLPVASVNDALAAGGAAAAADSAPAILVEALASGVRYAAAARKLLMRNLAAMAELPSHDARAGAADVPATAKELTASQAAAAEELRPRALDVWLAWLLREIPSLRKRVDRVLARAIERGPLTLALVTSALHGVAWRAHMPTLIGFADMLTRHARPALRESGAALFQAIAMRTDDPQQRQEILASLVALVGSGVPEQVQTGLRGLTLVCGVPGLARPFVSYLKCLLDFFDALREADVRTAFTLLCSVMFHNGKPVAGADEMLIMIRKQLSSPDVHIKRIGVLGLCAVVTEMAVFEEGVSGAIALLQQCLPYCQASFDAMALLFDELAARLVARRAARGLVDFLAEHVELDFEQNFLVELARAPEVLKEMPAVRSIEFALCEDLHLNADTTGGLAISLAPLVFAPLGKSSMLAVFPSVFRLLQTCERATSDGSMSNMDALLSCPLIYWTPVDEEVFEELADTVRDQLLTGTLAACNWVREVLSAFGAQSDKEMKLKLLKRLRWLVNEEARLVRFASKHPRWLVARASATSGATSGTPASAVAAPSSASGPLLTLEHDGAGAAGATGDHAALLLAQLRPLQLDALSVLKLTRPMVVTTSKPDGTTSSENVELDFDMLLYLLHDIVAKLHVFRKQKTVPQGVMNVQDESDFLSKTASLLGPCVKHVVRLATALRSSSNAASSTPGASSNGGTQGSAGAGAGAGAGADTSHAATARECLRLLFVVWDLLLSSTLFANDAGFRDVFLRSFGGRYAAEAPASELAEGAVKQLCGIQDCVQGIEQAATFITILRRMSLGVRDAALPISPCASAFLQVAWPKVKADALVTLVEAYVQCHVEPLACVEDLVDRVLAPFVAEESESGTMASLTSASFAAFFRGALQCVVAAAELLARDADASPERVLSDLLYMARLLDMLVRMIKVKDEIAVLRAVLVQSKRFLDVFLRRFMPRMAAWFSKHTDAVMDVILTLQKSTRALQHACNHVKGSKDPQVVSAVPQLKKMLELLLFRFKRVLTDRNKLDAFWLGNLRHKNLRGEEVASQLSNYSDSSASADEADGGTAAGGSGSEASSDAEQGTRQQRRRAAAQRKKPAAASAASGKSKKTAAGGQKRPGKPVAARDEASADSDSGAESIESLSSSEASSEKAKGRRAADDDGDDDISTASPTPSPSPPASPPAARRAAAAAGRVGRKPAARESERDDSASDASSSPLTASGSAARATADGNDGVDEDGEGSSSAAAADASASKRVKAGAASAASSVPTAAGPRRRKVTAAPARADDDDGRRSLVRRAPGADARPRPLSRVAPAVASSKTAAVAAAGTRRRVGSDDD